MIPGKGLPGGQHGPGGHVHRRPSGGIGPAGASGQKGQSGAGGQSDHVSPLEPPVPRQRGPVTLPARSGQIGAVAGVQIGQHRLIDGLRLGVYPAGYLLEGTGYICVVQIAEGNQGVSGRAACGIDRRAAGEQGSQQHQCKDFFHSASEIM